ncbi:MAG: hypothetical protein GY839_00525 [candidate division Zixibacteria bacterium]|nr:hypothetical protein [candidate division Zixibacteria bacterium]
MNMKINPRALTTILILCFSLVMISNAFGRNKSNYDDSEITKCKIVEGKDNPRTSHGTLIDDDEAINISNPRQKKDISFGYEINIARDQVVGLIVPDMKIGNISIISLISMEYTR